MAKKAAKKQPIHGHIGASGAGEGPRDNKGDAREEHDRIRQRQAAVVESMGLRRLNHTVELADTPSIRGMMHKVRHLITVE